MRAYIAFLKKELIESLRTYKLFITFSVFLLFGMLNPIIAKVMPELLKSFMPEGITITIHNPSAIDSWTQFYKNMTGIQMIIFVILFSGILVNEISKGTLINVLTKGLPRRTVILSKFTSTIVIWSVSYIICFGITYGYTFYLLPGELPNVFFSAFCMWLFGILLISVMLFASTLFTNLYGTLLFTGGFVMVSGLLNIISEVEKFNPYRLASKNITLLTGEMNASDFIISIQVTCVVVLMLLIGTLVLFNKKKL